MTVTPGREDEIEIVANAIDLARFQHPEHPRERPRPFSEADRPDREYAIRMARAAITTYTRLAAKPSSDPDAMNERRVEEDARLAANVREAVEHIEMAQSRLRAAMMGDEPCKPCIDLAASYLQEATKAFGSTTGEPER